MIHRHVLPVQRCYLYILSMLRLSAPLIDDTIRDEDNCCVFPPCRSRCCCEYFIYYMHSSRILFIITFYLQRKENIYTTILCPSPHIPNSGYVRYFISICSLILASLILLKMEHYKSQHKMYITNL